MNLLRLLPRFRQVYQALRVLETRAGWPRPDLEAHQFDRLNAVWANATAHVPHYRALTARAALPPRFGSLGEHKSLVPVPPKAVERDRPRDFLSERESLPAEVLVVGALAPSASDKHRPLVSDCAEYPRAAPPPLSVAHFPEGTNV